MTPVWVTLGFGLVVLVLVALVVRRPVRRFASSRAALRQALVPRVAALQALSGHRNRRDR